MAKAKRDKWARYIEQIEPQVFGMMDFRRWNSVYEEIVRANPRVLDYFRDVYAD